MSGREKMDEDQSEAGQQPETGVSDAGGALASAPRRTGGANATAGDGAAAGGSTLGGDVQARIGQHLRAMYDDVVRQGVPDRFMDLLSRLDQSAAGAPARVRDEEAGR